MKKLTSIMSLCLCLLGTIDVKASTNITHHFPQAHVIVVKQHKSYRLDSSYDESAVIFINKSNSDLTVRMNGSMLCVIKPGKSAMFWKNGRLWRMGFST